MTWNHCTKCRREFADAKGFVEHRCDADAVRRELMRCAILRMAARAENAVWFGQQYGLASTPTNMIRDFAFECREFARGLAQ
jgi:hypothetical protein